METITIKEYLLRRGIAFRENNGELKVRCVFGDCDADSTGDEAHLYFKAKTGQYNCKKCGESGNIFTLAKFFGDSIDDIALNPKRAKGYKNQNNVRFDVDLIERCHKALPDRIRTYLSKRGILNEVIDVYELARRVLRPMVDYDSYKRQ